METKMKKYFLTLFSIVFFSSAIYAQLSKKFEPIDVFDIEYVSSPEISPQAVSYTHLTLPTTPYV